MRFEVSSNRLFDLLEVFTIGLFSRSQVGNDFTDHDKGPLLRPLLLLDADGADDADDDEQDDRQRDDADDQRDQVLDETTKGPI